MAMIKCPECGREISDKATMCVHCGCPIKKQIKIDDMIIPVPSIISVERTTMKVPVEPTTSKAFDFFNSLTGGAYDLPVDYHEYDVIKIVVDDNTEEGDVFYVYDDEHCISDVSAVSRVLDKIINNHGNTSNLFERECYAFVYDYSGSFLYHEDLGNLYKVIQEAL